jgi:hypothetical protein
MRWGGMGRALRTVTSGAVDDEAAAVALEGRAKFRDEHGAWLSQQVRRGPGGCRDCLNGEVEARGRCAARRRQHEAKAYALWIDLAIHWCQDCAHLWCHAGGGSAAGSFPAPLVRLVWTRFLVSLSPAPADVAGRTPAGVQIPVGGSAISAVQTPVGCRERLRMPGLLPLTVH